MQAIDMTMYCPEVPDLMDYMHEIKTDSSFFANELRDNDVTQDGEYHIKVVQLAVDIMSCERMPETEELRDLALFAIQSGTGNSFKPFHDKLTAPNKVYSKMVKAGIVYPSSRLIDEAYIADMLVYHAYTLFRRPHGLPYAVKAALLDILDLFNDAYQEAK